MLQCFGTSIKVIVEAKYNIILFILSVRYRKNHIKVNFFNFGSIRSKSYSRVSKKACDLYDFLNKQW